MTGQPPNRRSREMRKGLIIAGVLLGVTALVAFLSPDFIRHDLGQRLLGILTGALIVYYANAVPKALRPLAKLRCDPAVEQAIRRFVGWSIVLGGTAYTLSWILTPVDVAAMLAPSLLGTTLLVVFIRTARQKLRA